MHPYQSLINPLLLAETTLAILMVALAVARIAQRKRSKDGVRGRTSGFSAILLMVQMFCLGAVITLGAVNLFLIHENHQATVTYLTHCQQLHGVSCVNLGFSKDR